jgi:hypothetical protein
MHFLRIRPEQMDAFREDVTRRFVTQEIARVSADFHLVPDAAKQVVEPAITRATALGIDDEADVVTFIDWYAVRGPGFDLEPKYAAVKATLEDDSLPGWARMKLAAEALEKQPRGV